jgi:signal transduction histidine kinase
LGKLFRTWPLWRQIAFGIIALMVSVSFAVGEINRHFERTAMAKDAHEGAHQILNVLTATMLDAVITEDIPQLETIINQAVSAEPSIQQVRISNEDNLTLLRWRRKQDVPEQELLVDRQEITLEGELFGHMTLSVDMSEAYREIEHHINMMRLHLALLITLLAIASYGLIQKLVTQPLGRIEQHIRNLLTGDLNQELSINSSRDLRLLTDSINNHASALRREQQHLQAVQSAKEAAEAASQAKSRFLSTMSHELRTPIHGILGIVQLLEIDCTNDEQREQLDTLTRSAQRLSTLINNILDFTNITNGEVTKQTTAFDLKLMAMESLLAYESEAAEKGLELRLDFRASCEGLLLGDAGLMQRVLSILIGNAMKFTPCGYVALRISCDHSVDGKLPLLIQVEDSGIGIAEKDQTGLFDAFAQADSTLTRDYGGCGIGLAVCQQLVALLGGQLGVESCPGRGSTFWVRLSLPPASQSPSSGLRKSGLETLNPTRLSEMRELLGNDFQELIQASLESIRTNLPQLVLALKNRDESWQYRFRELRSLGENIGADLLDTKLLRLETVVRKNTPEAALELLPEIEREQIRVEQALISLLAQRPQAQLSDDAA